MLERWTLKAAYAGRGREAACMCIASYARGAWAFPRVSGNAAINACGAVCKEDEVELVQARLTYMGSTLAWARLAWASYTKQLIV